MLVIILKILMMFITTIALMRMMGKASIVQLTPYDLVATFIIATIAAEPLITTKFIPALFRLAIVIIFYIILAKLSLHQTINKLLLGSPTILVRRGEIIEDNLEKSHVSLRQLLSILRTSGYSKITEIEFAILEPTGSISIIPRPAARPATLSDLDIDGEYEGLPLALIIDGTIQQKNLKLVKQDERWLKNKLKEKNVTNIKDVIYAFIDSHSNKVYLNLRNKSKK
ncbi:putative membrane protein [Halobacteroides halobius DSM 5150]|uniref:Putative membrane protein n=1 Tax=Halobacteroides halobius (strain ATCC 35273 / DSM 5150 / MD-1) TaxID=748449 RepID=L0K9R1_HALHC|nr:DUF421 domain-containing protein [Halobacteroides halobius]AGB41109.1 putative membrane protein [Halobacteroides halobius DSM 5150]